MDIRTIIKIVLITFIFIGLMALKWYWYDDSSDNEIEECAELVIKGQSSKKTCFKPLTIEIKIA